MATRPIKLLGEPIQNEDDKAADGTILPGHLLAYNGGGNLIRHATAGGKAQKKFAMEREEAGQGSDVLYATGDIVKVGVFATGDRVNALVAAAAAAIVKGDRLTSAGDGTLKKSNGTTDNEIAVASVALDNSAGASAARLDAEIL